MPPLACQCSSTACIMSAYFFYLIAMLFNFFFKPSYPLPPPPPPDRIKPLKPIVSPIFREGIRRLETRPEVKLLVGWEEAIKPLPKPFRLGRRTVLYFCSQLLASLVIQQSADVTPVLYVISQLEDRSLYLLWHDVVVQSTTCSFPV